MRRRPAYSSVTSFLILAKQGAAAPFDKWDQTGVVYKFTCKNCPATCIGETKRSLKTRINEHKKNKNIESVIHTHRNSLNHEFNWDDTKIIDIERDYKKRLIGNDTY